MNLHKHDRELRQIHSHLMYNKFPYHSVSVIYRPQDLSETKDNIIKIQESKLFEKWVNDDVIKEILTMNNLDKKYTDILQDILDNGVVKGDRTGTGTKSVFSREIRHKMSDGFPLLTTKKMAWKTMVTELLWFLRGDTNTQYLVQNNCNIWVGDTYKEYVKCTSANDSIWNEWMRDNGDDSLSMYTKLEFIEKLKTDDKFAARWGDIGPGYGKQWRKWDNPIFLKEETGEEWYKETESIDQIQVLIDTLRKNPDSRRLMVSAWNVEDVPKTLLPPCHYAFECWTRELSVSERLQFLENKNPNRNPGYELGKSDVPKREISLRWVQRSCDFPLGVPFNIASYGLLLTLIADEVNMIPGDLIGLFGDSHIYLDQIEGAKEQIGMELSYEELRKLYPELKEFYDKKIQCIKDQDYVNAAATRDKEKEFLDKLPTHRTREPLELPTVKVKNGIDAGLDDIELIGYQSHSKINFPLSN